MKKKQGKIASFAIDSRAIFFRCGSAPPCIAVSSVDVTHSSDFARFGFFCRQCCWQVCDLVRPLNQSVRPSIIPIAFELLFCQLGVEQKYATFVFQVLVVHFHVIFKLIISNSSFCVDFVPMSGFSFSDAHMLCTAVGDSDWRLGPDCGR
jgi:hypothetical protein